MSVCRIIFLFLLLASAAFAQSKDSVMTDGASGVATPQAQWHARQYPTAGHGRLEGMSGLWRITATLWLAGPDKPPVNGNGFGQWRTLFGSRYLEIEDSVVVAGQSLRTMGYMSWEEGTQQLQLELLTNTGTALYATGSADSAWYNFTFAATAPRPLRLLRHWISGNHWRLEVFNQTPQGREYKLIDAEYVRSYGP